VREGQGDPGKGPTANAQQRKGSTPIEVVANGWRFTFALDAEPATGQLRDIAGLVATVAGVDRDSALAAVLAAVAAPLVVWQAAA
jgi:hypothetical protein